jgi:hypothetical protein
MGSRVRIVACAALGLVLAGAGGARGADAVASVPPPAAADAHGFQSFCAEWMKKLQARVPLNVQRIEWRTEGDAVVGQHVDYGKESTCVVREEPGKDPIGKISYRETTYERRGATPEAALAAPGTAVEVFDVTEIFRFAKGRWQY